VAEARALRRGEQLIAREFQRRAITEDPDAPEMRLKLDLLIENLRFWNPNAGQASVWLVASARAADLRGEQTEQGWSYAVRARGGVLTPDSVLTFQVDRRLELERPLPAEAGVELRYALNLQPGQYPMTLAVLDENQGRDTGNWLQDTLRVPDYGMSLPIVSDLALAADSGGTWTRDGETFLRVTPAHVPGADSVIHIYFEVYGIPSGGEYEVNVRLVAGGSFESLSEVEARAPAFQLSYRAAMPERSLPIGTHHARVDLRDTQRGDYTLVVYVRDLETQVTSLPTTTWVRQE
jgi:hypothetical protein